VRRTAPTDTDDSPGHDSFLDIVTNIVGILIILVMVVGVQAKDAWIEAADETVSDVLEDEIDVETPRAAAASVEAEIHAIMEKTNRVTAEAKAHFVRREQLQLLVTAAQQDLERRRGELDDAARQEFDATRQLDAAREEAEQLRRQRHAVEQSQGHDEVIEHLPTPLAKTVFGREQHFRLQRGRLTYVPINELVDHLTGEWQEKVWRLEDAPQVTETIGPVNGFRMKYTLERKQIQIRTSAGVAVRDVAGLSRFILVPVSDGLGEPIGEALRPNSDFHRRLDTYDPQSTTITIWCYPDTFAAFGEVKRVLYERGFRTAGRPLPAGHPIGGSPDGSRSVSE
jgi:hypothetical protein